MKPIKIAGHTNVFKYREKVTNFYEANIKLLISCLRR